MVAQAVEHVTQEIMDEYIREAARVARYEAGFGIAGCDLSMPIWWAAYCRQSLDQQSQNSRLPEYLLTLAKMAKEQGVTVPREYIGYDHVSGEHLDRPAIRFIRHELVDKKKVLGILFADLRCLSREPAPQQVFERECEIRDVRLIFGDAPSGMDVGSAFARSAITFSNKLTRLATHRNAAAGNVGRVLRGWAPACKAAHGYAYRRDAEITDGRMIIKKAWWEIDSLDPDGKPVSGSPADAITKIFDWMGKEGRSCFWVAKKLNELGFSAPYGGRWSGNTLRRVVMRHCYTGRNTYNANVRVSNPARPMGDVTGAVKRTLIRPKPAGEAVTYAVPALVSEGLWQKANDAMHQRGRGRGKEGKSIASLLRNRIFCPRCGKPMVVRRRRAGTEKLYYHCSRAHNIFAAEPCGYRSFVPGDWDEAVWDVVYVLLKQDAWVEDRLNTVSKQHENIEKLLKLEQLKAGQAQTKISKVREGFEGGLYSLDEAKAKVAGYQLVAAQAEQEIERLRRKSGAAGKPAVNIAELKAELQRIAGETLDQATFAERLDIVCKLNIKVYPSEDLRTMRIKCRLPLEATDDSLQDRCGIIAFGSTGSP